MYSLVKYGSLDCCDVIRIPKVQTLQKKKLLESDKSFGRPLVISERNHCYENNDRLNGSHSSHSKSPLQKLQSHLGNLKEAGSFCLFCV